MSDWSTSERLYLLKRDGILFRDNLSHSLHDFNTRSLLQRFGGVAVDSPDKDILYGKPRYDYSGGE